MPNRVTTRARAAASTPPPVASKVKKKTYTPYKPRPTPRGAKCQEKKLRGTGGPFPWTAIPSLVRYKAKVPVKVRRDGKEVNVPAPASRYMEFVRRGGGHNLVSEGADDAEYLKRALTSSSLLAEGAKRCADAIANGGDRSSNTMIRREGTWATLEGWAMLMLNDDSQWMKQLLTLDKVLYAPGPRVPALKDFKLTVPVPACFLTTFFHQMSSTPPLLPHKYDHGGEYQFMSENPEFKGRGMNGRMISGSHLRGLRADIAEFEKDLVGTTEAHHASNKAMEMEHRAKDVKNSAKAYLIDKELPKMYDAVFNENEMNGVPGFGSHLQMYKVWAMLLMHHVLLARRSQLTVYCPLIQDVEFGPACGESAVPAYMNITVRRWKGNEVGRKAARTFHIKRNLNDARFCPVFNLARWLAILAENGVEQGPLFPLTNEGRVSDPLEMMTPGQWGAWIQKVFDRAGGVLKMCTSHSIRRSAAQWACRCGAKLDEVMRGGLWETVQQLMMYLQEGRMVNQDRINECGYDDVENFWKWEGTCQFQPTE